jgi:hypothetical protein
LGCTAAPSVLLNGEPEKCVLEYKPYIFSVRFYTHMKRRIHFCSESRAALAALAKTTSESAFVWEYMQA